MLILSYYCRNSTDTSITVVSWERVLWHGYTFEQVSRMSVRKETSQCVIWGYVLVETADYNVELLFAA